MRRLPWLGAPSFLFWCCQPCSRKRFARLSRNGRSSNGCAASLLQSAIPHLSRCPKQRNANGTRARVHPLHLRLFLACRTTARHFIQPCSSNIGVVIVRSHETFRCVRLLALPALPHSSSAPECRCRRFLRAAHHSFWLRCFLAMGKVALSSHRRARLYEEHL